MRKISLVFLIAVSVFACKKGNLASNDQILNGSYLADPNFYAEPAIMYTSNSVITDQQFIKDFLIRWGFTYNQIYTPSIPYPAPYLTLKTITADSMIVSIDNPVPNTPGYKDYHTKLTENNATGIQLRAKDTTKGYFYYDCDVEWDMAIKNKFSLGCQNVGGNPFCSFFQEFPFVKEGEFIFIPYFSIWATSGIQTPNGSYGFCSKLYNRAFVNENRLHNISSSDTIIIQKEKCRLNRQ